jgi:hypothetical protein
MSPETWKWSFGKLLEVRREGGREGGREGRVELWWK